MHTYMLHSELILIDVVVFVKQTTHRNHPWQIQSRHRIVVLSLVHLMVLEDHLVERARQYQEEKGLWYKEGE
jgi:hypothetical protein